jgi:HD superfamily phosphohydrolase
MAALCHDAGHLPFSHAAENELLPLGWDHERLTARIIQSMDRTWRTLKPPLDWLDIAKLAVGPTKWPRYVKAGDFPPDAAPFGDWETILAEVIVGDAFGVDRMDYLLRDSHHAGVAYGRFDHYRLIDTLRILPKKYEGESQEPALGVEEGGLRSAEALLLARYFMYSQVYFHPVRRIYDVHLKDFLCEWLHGRYPNNRFSTAVDVHLALTDNEVTAAILQAARDKESPGHDAARRIVEREHFRCVYQWNPDDAKVNREAGEALYEAASGKFGRSNLRHEAYPAKSAGVDFPVLTKDQRVMSSFAMSDVLQRIPAAAFDYVFVRADLREEVEKWIEANRATIIRPGVREETDGTAKT